MSDEIVAALIGLAGALVVAVPTWIVHKKRVNKLDPKTDIPSPFACASCDAEPVIQISDGYKATFNLISAYEPEKIQDFVSMVFQFSQAVDAKKFHTLEFEIRFGEGAFQEICLELHPNDCLKTAIWKQSIPRTESWKQYKIDLTSPGLKDVMSSIREICFVVKKEYFTETNKDLMKGTFDVRHLQIVK